MNPQDPSRLMSSSQPDPFVDDLVGQRNRRAFDVDVPAFRESALASNLPFGLLLFDIDKFKSINDDHGGHATGDEVLAAIAARVAQAVRGKGTLYRISGDEFALALPNHSVDESVAVAERVRVVVNDSPVGSRSLKVTVSIGVAVAPQHGRDFPTLRAAADRAAYDAKDWGRNLVRVVDEPREAVKKRDVPRRKPEPGGLTEEQGRRVLQEYCRTGSARCPIDEARLKVVDMTAAQDLTARILVHCPLCGVSASLGGGGR